MRAAYRPSDVRLLDRHGEVLHELRVDANAPAPRLDAAGGHLAGAAARRAGRRGPALLRPRRRRRARARRRRRRSVVAGGRRAAPARSPCSSRPCSTPTPGGSMGPRTLAQKWRQMRPRGRSSGAGAKAEILEAYLNLVTFRGELQGVGGGGARAVRQGAARPRRSPRPLVLAVLAARAQCRAPPSCCAAPRCWLPRSAAPPRAAELAASGDVEPWTRRRARDRASRSRRTSRASCCLDAAPRRAGALDARRRARSASPPTRCGGTSSRCAARHVEDGAVLVVDNAIGRRARLRRQQRRRCRSAPARRRRARAPPGRLDAEAVPLRRSPSTSGC